MKSKIKTIIILILSILLVIFGVLTIYPHCSHKMKYKHATNTIYIKRVEIEYNYSKQEIRNKLEDITGISWYIYREKNLKEGTYGRTQLMFRTIEVEPSISENKYIEVVCHELLHLKYYTLNERFTTYQTFVTLYNSEFKQVALNMIHDMQYGEYLYEYECYAQIVEYLEKQPI